MCYTKLSFDGRRFVMKKFLFAIAAGCCLTAFQVNADALSILRNTRIKSEQTVSVNNLTNLYQVVVSHFEGSRKYPTLEELNLPARTLAKSLMTTSKGPISSSLASNSGER